METINNTTQQAIKWLSAIQNLKLSLNLFIFMWQPQLPLSNLLSSLEIHKHYKGPFINASTFVVSSFAPPLKLLTWAQSAPSIVYTVTIAPTAALVWPLI